MKRSRMAIGMNAAISDAGSKWSSIAGTTLTAAFPLWLLVAAILAATMGTWPPHIYI